jgi:co-chaperonin GroES (HSP10)
MIPVPNLELVLIIPEKLEDEIDLGETKIVKSDIQKENEKKAQNRGTIFAVGDDVKFWKKGDFVSFYRAASTKIEEDGKVYFTINHQNILCKFVTDGKK